MKKNAFYLILLLILLPSVCLADKPKTKNNGLDLQFVVSAVDLKKQTITVTHQGKDITATYLITPLTTIEINDKNASLKDVKVGMEVRSSRLQSGESTLQVLEDLDLKK